MKNSIRSSDVDDGELNTASRVASYQYDGLNRRVVRAITNSGFLNSTYHDYFNGWSLIEVRDGSDNVLKHQVWGTQYIDELVQVGINDDPTDAAEDDCETFYYALQDANYNVIGLTNSTGDLVERYEYTPYGQRQVYFSPGSNDPDCNAPLLISQRVEVNGSPGVYQPYGLCAFGHQGKMHDEATPGLKYNNQRMYHTQLGRFITTDPWMANPFRPSPGDGYPDGMNRYAGYHIMHGGVDPMGLALPPGDSSLIRESGGLEPLLNGHIDWSTYGGKLLPNTTLEQAKEAQIRGWEKWDRFKEAVWGSGACCGDKYYYSYELRGKCCVNGKLIPKSEYDAMQPEDYLSSTDTYYLQLELGVSLIVPGYGAHTEVGISLNDFGQLTINGQYSHGLGGGTYIGGGPSLTGGYQTGHSSSLSGYGGTHTDIQGGYKVDSGLSFDHYYDENGTIGKSVGVDSPLGGTGIGLGGFQGDSYNGTLFSTPVLFDGVRCW